VATNNNTVFSFTLQDSLGSKTSTQVYAVLGPTVTIDDITTIWSTLAGYLDADSDAQLLGGKITLEQVPTGVKGAPVIGARIEQVGNFGFSADGTSKRYTFKIPGIAAGVLNGDRINLGTAPIAGLISALTDEETGYTNETFQLILTFVDSFVSFHKARKQLERSSYEV